MSHHTAAGSRLPSVQFFQIPATALSRMRAQGLTLSARFLYMTLFTYARMRVNRGGGLRVEAGWEDLADAAGLSKSSFFNARTQLLSGDFIRVDSDGIDIVVPPTTSKRELIPESTGPTRTPPPLSAWLEWLNRSPALRGLISSLSPRDARMVDEYLKVPVTDLEGRLDAPWRAKIQSALPDLRLRYLHGSGSPSRSSGLREVEDELPRQKVTATEVAEIRKSVLTLPVPQERAEELTKQIVFAASVGTLRFKPFRHAANICLKLIREERWKTPYRFAPECVQLNDSADYLVCLVHPQAVH
ncbi:MAG: hypothetical protein E6Q76_14440 [Rhizobium sp.]|nr:MAG: hypothetical protein E6Q76_14440 [Rhizobium sp.]